MDADSQPEGVPVVEAAALLGVSTDALRKRVARGRMPGYKRDGQWYVIMPGSDRSTSVNTEDVTGASPDRVSELREEVRFLRERLAARDDAIEEMRRDHVREVEQLHILLQNTQRMIPASVESSNSPQTPERPREAFGQDRRGEKANVDSVSSGEAERPSGEPRRSWLSRLMGWE